ncbi:MAG: DUF503 domain-containing protein [Candidatus Aminicenantes bacterium]|nr:DUF503 domain-containing protein [Candidatus Aminicenantes bacterium]
MITGILAIDLFTEQFHSLKEKRQLLASLKKRLKNKFNIALAESDYQELWQKAQLTIVALGANQAIVDRTFKEIEDFIFLNYAVQVTKMKIRYC